MFRHKKRVPEGTKNKKTLTIVFKKLEECAMKLYELTQNHLNLMELLDNPETPKEMIEVALAEVTESIEVKI